MKTFILGKTTSGLPILAYEFGSSGPHVLIMGGVHGDEIEGVTAAYGLLERFMVSFDYHLRLIVIPKLNVEGVLNKTRVNGRGVDLNRNLPSKDWNPKAFNLRYPPGPFANSEPENQALVKLLDSFRPRMIFSLHSWKPLLNPNGDCRPEAERLSQLTGYGVEDTIGYPTPGCLGTYAGIEKGMPTLTYEIERGLAASEILRVHVPAILETLKVTETRFTEKKK